MSETIFSLCREYRYTLWREWDCDSLTGCADDLPNIHKFAMFISLNPSTADETLDDPTIRRCIGFAKTWGFGGLCMTNLFAFRATDPKVMKAQSDPVGPNNDAYLTDCAKDAGIIIAAWGAHGSHQNRAGRVKAMMADHRYPLHALHINADGSPKHPLYIAAATKPSRFLATQNQPKETV